MRTPRVTINNLFAGYARAGMDPQHWYENLTDEQRLGAQLDFIEARACLLERLPYDEGAGIPGNVQNEAKRLNRLVQQTMAAMSQGQMIQAGGFMLDIGVAMQKISTHLTAAKALDVTEELQRPRSAGGKQTAIRKQEAAAENIKTAARHWHKLAADGRPERVRAGVIAQIMGYPVGTVRGWIKKAGLR
ncbi:hypothetical protein [Marinobacter sp. DUT-1]|uniref:hypothetical protein n=1 Tax=Marinobacter sp. DUT-1 TaxID=3412037 RepID=UPI003D16D261